MCDGKEVAIHFQKSGGGSKTFRKFRFSLAVVELIGRWGLAALISAHLCRSAVPDCRFGTPVPGLLFKHKIEISARYLKMKSVLGLLIRRTPLLQLADRFAYFEKLPNLARSHLQLRPDGRNCRGRDSISFVLIRGLQTIHSANEKESNGVSLNLSVAEIGLTSLLPATLRKQRPWRR